MFFLKCLQLFIPYIRFLRILLILQKNAPYVSNCFYVSHFWQYLKTLFAYKRHYNFNSILFATLKWSWNDVNCKRTVYKIYLGRNIFHVNSSCSNLSLNDSYQMIKGKWSKMTKYRLICTHFPSDIFHNFVIYAIAIMDLASILTLFEKNFSFLINKHSN